MVFWSPLILRRDSSMERTYHHRLIDGTGGGLVPLTQRRFDRIRRWGRSQRAQTDAEEFCSAPPNAPRIARGREIQSEARPRCLYWIERWASRLPHTKRTNKKSAYSREFRCWDWTRCPRPPMAREAALTILLPLGALGLVYIGPIILIILALLAVLYFSYRQTIAAYPSGGGSYTVAKENLGERAGLLAAAALLLDYVLNVAVGISAGVGALISALPALHPHILALCLGILAFITLINLRGARESGLAFALPTYLFVGTLGACAGYRNGESFFRAAGIPAPIVPARSAPRPRRWSRRDAVAPDAGVCQRLRRHDGRGSGQQRGERVREACGPGGAADADRHRRDSGRSAGGHRVFVPCVSDWRDRPGQGGLSKRHFAADRGHRRQRRFLLRHDWQCAGGFGPVRQHQFRRLSAPVPVWSRRTIICPMPLATGGGV